MARDKRRVLDVREMPAPLHHHEARIRQAQDSINALR